MSGNHEPNVKQVVPFFRVADMERSLRFYIDGLGFTMKNKWVPDGKLCWCWLELGGAALMLQEFRREGSNARPPMVNPGDGVSLCFQCADALAVYREATQRGLAAREPEVGNGLWYTALSDPDGYRVEFHSPTDVPEDTTLSEWQRSQGVREDGELQAARVDPGKTLRDQ
jgi:lactoylglutathione lyase